MKLSLDDLPIKELLPGFDAKMVHTDNVTISFVDVAAGAALPEHAHFNEQVTHLIAGSFELTVNGEPILMKPGDVVIIPTNAPHSGKALVNSRLMDVFNPAREDYK